MNSQKSLSCENAGERMKRMIRETWVMVKNWYGRENRVYSAVAGSSITPRAVLRLYVATAVVAVVAVCAMKDFLVTSTVSACSGWLVYHTMERKNRE